MAEDLGEVRIASFRLAPLARERMQRGFADLPVLVLEEIDEPLGYETGQRLVVENARAPTTNAPVRMRESFEHRGHGFGTRMMERDAGSLPFCCALRAQQLDPLGHVFLGRHFALLKKKPIPPDFRRFEAESTFLHLDGTDAQA
jgi:hypothetical protein